MEPEKSDIEKLQECVRQVTTIRRDLEKQAQALTGYRTQLCNILINRIAEIEKEAQK